MFGKVRANVSLSRGLVYIVLLAGENEFPLKTGDKTAGLGLMGKRKTGTSARTFFLLPLSSEVTEEQFTSNGW